MDRDTPDRSELAALARRVGGFVACFLAGGVVAFVYSYVPLHNAKNWKIEYLSERLETKDARLQRLEQELSATKAAAADMPDGDTFAMLQSELASTDKSLKGLESKLARAEKRVKELEASRRSWQQRHAKAEAERDALASRLERQSSSWSLSGSPDAEPADAGGVPAAPAPGTTDPSAAAAN